MVAQLVTNGLIHDPADLFFLTKERLFGLERMAEKSASDLLEAIGRAKSPPLDRLIFASAFVISGNRRQNGSRRPAARWTP